MHVRCRLLDDSFLLKSTMTTSLSAVVGIFVMQIMLYSYMLMMFERATEEGPLQNFTNSVWLIIVTMTTVSLSLSHSLSLFLSVSLSLTHSPSLSLSLSVCGCVCVDIHASLLP